MATDIAFAVGVVSLVGNRIPAAAKLFLLALAIVDDIGAIAVIAVFYTSNLSLGWLVLSALSFISVVTIRRLGVRSLLPYVVLGVFAWFAMHESGVHATITGVVMGLLTPTTSFHDPARFRATAIDLVEGIDKGYRTGEFGEEHEQADATLNDLQRLASETESPLDRVEGRLHLWSSFIVIPLFALANAGVELSGDVISDAVSEPVVLGVALGLVVGKPVGIVLASVIAVRTGIARLPGYTTWLDMVGLGMLGGVGFTVALFVAGLAFPGNPELLDLAKVGILAGSLVAGVVGWGFLRVSAPVPPHAAQEID
jgi:NhaA family Na+:H+ antiporter